MEKRKSQRVKKLNESLENRRTEEFELQTQKLLHDNHSFIAEIVDNVFGNQLQSWEKSRQRCCLSQAQFTRHLLALHDLYCCRCQSSYGNILNSGRSMQRPYTAGFIIPPELEIKQEPVDNGYPEYTDLASSIVGCEGSDDESTADVFTAFNHDTLLEMSTMAHNNQSPGLTQISPSSCNSIGPTRNARQSCSNSPSKGSSVIGSMLDMNPQVVLTAIDKYTTSKQRHTTSRERHTTSKERHTTSMTDEVHASKCVSGSRKLASFAKSVKHPVNNHGAIHIVDTSAEVLRVKRNEDPFVEDVEISVSDDIRGTRHPSTQPADTCDSENHARRRPRLSLRAHLSPREQPAVSMAQNHINERRSNSRDRYSQADVDDVDVFFKRSPHSMIKRKNITDDSPMKLSDDSNKGSFHRQSRDERSPVKKTARKLFNDSPICRVLRNRRALMNKQKLAKLLTDRRSRCKAREQIRHQLESEKRDPNVHHRTGRHSFKVNRFYSNSKQTAIHKTSVSRNTPTKMSGKVISENDGNAKNVLKATNNGLKKQIAKDHSPNVTLTVGSDGKIVSTKLTRRNTMRSPSDSSILDPYRCEHCKLGFTRKIDGINHSKIHK